MNRDDMFGGRKRYGLMRFLALAMGLVEQKTGKIWSEDVVTKEAVKEAIADLLDLFGPKGETGLTDLIESKKLAEEVTSRFSDSIREAPSSSGGEDQS